ncbi:hypothetical protein N752_29660 [Desulforamulus aquiferis]|nr:hypothetical protein N752_29660 [Desulforamulus aquiferis]
MPDKPLILFPKRSNATRKNLGGGSAKIKKPSFSRQVERVAPKLQRLQDNMNKIVLKNAPVGIEPEYALVLETAGSPDSFLGLFENSLQQCQG